jgi:16S rRNA (cytosine1402-N4)-methyltransferase
MASAAALSPGYPHIPVLLRPLLAAVAPVTGVWLDGTFGAGGYTRGLLAAGAARVVAVDRDPLAFEMARGWAADFGDRIVMQPGVFSRLDSFATDLDGVVLDLGVSSMQLDQADRGFSFMKDGPLDMRMSQQGSSAADLVNGATEADLADILYHFGEERAARRIARAIIAARPVTRTLALAEVIAGCLPRPKPGQSHPATRSFQAIRIAVNDEYGELVAGLMAAERALKPGGALAVVTFHSVEDRIVKRFFQAGAGAAGNANRYAPATVAVAPVWKVVTKKAISADADELAANPRARSAMLRIARRTDAPARLSAAAADARALGVPVLPARRQ